MSTENSLNTNSIDIKQYLYKVLSYWKLFLVTIIIGFIVARFMNGYKQKRYSLDTTISVKEENNPLFSTGTNIAFNWGGESNEIGTVKVILNSRTHNEKVVDSLQFYISYLQEGRYRMEDVYGMTPFKVNIEKDKPQLYGRQIKIEATSANKFKLSFVFAESNKNGLISYVNNVKEFGDGAMFSAYISNEPEFSKEFTVNEKINTPFLNLSIDALRDFVPGESILYSLTTLTEL